MNPIQDFQFWYNVVLGVLGTGTLTVIVTAFLNRKRTAADIKKVQSETNKIAKDADKTVSDSTLSEANAAESIQRAASGLMKSVQERLDEQGEELKSQRVEIKDLRLESTKKDLQIADLGSSLVSAQRTIDGQAAQLEQTSQITWLQANWIRSGHEWMKDAYEEINRLGGTIRPVPPLDDRLLAQDDAS